jgi:IclR family pca regulon transcriptional regulator
MESMAGLAKGLSIIEAFTSGWRQLTVADAARVSGATRAAARRCLLTLAELGYVGYDGKFFRPLPRLLRLGSGYLNAASLPQLAQPILTALRDQLGESISLAVRDEDWSVFIARAEADRIVSTGVKVGARLPCYCSATGRVFLSAVSAEELDRYLERVTPQARTPKTITDKAIIRSELEKARTEGVAFSEEELELGMISVAVPVFDPAGQVVAALSMSALSARLTADDIRRDHLPLLRHSAEMLGRNL